GDARSAYDVAHICRGHAATHAGELRLAGYAFGGNGTGNRLHLQRTLDVAHYLGAGSAGAYNFGIAWRLDAVGHAGVVKAQQLSANADTVSSLFDRWIAGK